MTRSRLGLVTLAAVALGVACANDSHTTFNVDVYSFVKDKGADTVVYSIPGPVPPFDTTVDVTPVKINLLGGFGGTTVQSVTMTGTAHDTNTAGSGSAFFELFFSADSASTYQPQHVALASDTIQLAPDSSGTLTIGGGLTSALDSLFTQQTLWVGLRTGIHDAGAAMAGTITLTGLKVTIVINNKGF